LFEASEGAMKIYTKQGDDGTTGLFGSSRVRKDSIRVSAYGDVDELNALLGLARSEGPDAELGAMLERIQGELFTLGAQLATPSPEDAPRSVPVITEPHVSQLEHEIDRLDAELPPLKSFILPSGTRLASLLHVCRTVCRRAERSVVTLASSDPVPPLSIQYLNRLSDHLFTLARAANHRAGVSETRWEPNRR
jgi:cob(I)alamin adenosyltransferase